MLAGRIKLLLWSVAALLAACASSSGVNGQPAGAGAPREYLDDTSGVTVTSMTKPLLFAHDRPEKRAQLRDYVTVAAASVNRQGHRDYLLIAYLWSTLDASHEPTRAVPDTVVLLADNHPIRLEAGHGTPADFGIVRPVGAPAGRTVKTLLLVTDLDTLDSVGKAQTLQVQAQTSEGPVDYVLWDDQRKAMEGLVRYLNGER